MDHQSCDMCGCDLLLKDLRYTVKLEIKSAYDPLELTSRDLRKNFRKEIENLVRQLDTIEVRDAENQVYAVMDFDLCPACQKELLTDPLGTGRRMNPEEKENDDG